MHRHSVMALLTTGALLIGGAAHAEGLEACREADFTVRPVDTSAREVEHHRLTPEPVIVYPRGSFPQRWMPDIVVAVDPTGKPLCYVPLEAEPSGLLPRRMAAIKGLADQRFRPFMRNGQAVTAAVTLAIIEEEALAGARPIPDARPEDTLITLERSGCYGACPTYSVTISGTGRVHYEGGSYTVVQRNLSYNISPEAVAQIMASFEAAAFWSLRDEYIGFVTDNPTTEVTLKRGARTKKLTDYVGRSIGMPRTASRLEDDIDRLSGALDLTRGSETMLPRLDGLSYDFKSPEAVTVMESQVQDGSLGLITGFFDRGVPPQAALTPSASYGRFDVFQAARARGADLTPELRCALQVPAAAGQDLAFFMALTGPDGALCRPETILADLMDTHIYTDLDFETGLSCNNSATWCYRREPLKILQYLLSHGANMYAVNGYGRLPIDYTFDDETMAAYMAAGYDINHQDADGNTALMRDAMGMAMRLLKHGADPFIRNNAGEDYYTRAKANNDAAVLAYIDAHRHQYKNAPK